MFEPACWTVCRRRPGRPARPSAPTCCDGLGGLLDRFVDRRRPASSTVSRTVWRVRSTASATVAARAGRPPRGPAASRRRSRPSRGRRSPGARSAPPPAGAPARRTGRGGRRARRLPPRPCARCRRARAPSPAASGARRPAAAPRGVASARVGGLRRRGGGRACGARGEGCSPREVVTPAPVAGDGERGDAGDRLAPARARGSRAGAPSQPPRPADRRRGLLAAAAEESRGSAARRRGGGRRAGGAGRRSRSRRCDREPAARVAVGGVAGDPAPLAHAQAAVRGVGDDRLHARAALARREALVLLAQAPAGAEQRALDARLGHPEALADRLVAQALELAQDEDLVMRVRERAERAAQVVELLLDGDRRLGRRAARHEPLAVGGREPLALERDLLGAAAAPVGVDAGVAGDLVDPGAEGDRGSVARIRRSAETKTSWAMSSARAWSWTRPATKPVIGAR